MKALSLTAVIAAAALSAGLAFAATSAPQPAKPVTPQVYSGRWYEIARIPNQMQRDCEGATSEFRNFADGQFRVVQTCHKGSPTGPAQTFNANGRILPASNNAKLRMSFFGGVVSQEYWILDRADDNAWAIMATPGGNYVWLLSRRPVMDAATRARIIARISALGFNTARLQYPQQAG